MNEQDLRKRIKKGESYKIIGDFYGITEQSIAYHVNKIKFTNPGFKDEELVFWNPEDQVRHINLKIDQDRIELTIKSKL